MAQLAVHALTLGLGELPAWGPHWLPHCALVAPTCHSLGSQSAFLSARESLLRPPGAHSWLGQLEPASRWKGWDSAWQHWVILLGRHGSVQVPPLWALKAPSTELQGGLLQGGGRRAPDLTRPHLCPGRVDEVLAGLEHQVEGLGPVSDPLFQHAPQTPGLGTFLSWRTVPLVPVCLLLLLKQVVLL